MNPQVIDDQTAPPNTNWKGLLFLVALYLTLAYFSWHRLGDVLIDFGRELYVPWRLAEGEVLYRDIAYFNGPLSPYLNSIAFRLCGTSLNTLLISNLALIAMLMIMIYRFFSRACNQTIGTIITAFFLIGFAIKHTNRYGIFSFVAPYSHEMTHGIFLIIAALSVLGSPLGKQAIWRKVAAAFIVGMAFLTKPEMGLAAVSSFSVWWFIHQADRTRTESIQFFKALFALLKESWILVFAILPFVTAVGLLSTEMTISEAMNGGLGGWRYVFDDQIRNNRFYHQLAGTNRIQLNIQLMVLRFVSASLLITAAVLLDRWFTQKEARRFLIGAIGMILIAAGINAALFPNILFYDRPTTTLTQSIRQSAIFGILAMIGFAGLLFFKRLEEKSQKLLLIASGITGFLAASVNLNPMLIPPRSLPIFSIMVFGFALFATLRKNAFFDESGSNEDDSTNRKRTSMALMLPWMCFGIVMLLKVFLSTRLVRYGFALTLPAMLGTVGFLVYFLSIFARTRWKGGKIAEAIWLGILVVDLIAMGTQSLNFLQQKSFPVGLGTDSILTSDHTPDSRGQILQQLLLDLKNRVQSDESVLVLPEGITINFWLRRRTATRYTNFMPIEVAMYGEGNILAEIKSSPPDFVVFAQKDTREYGYRTFGSDGYGDQIKNWILGKYKIEKQFGNEPFADGEKFGLQVLIPISNEQR